MLSSRLKVGRLKGFRLRYHGADVIPPTAPSGLVATLAAPPSADVLLGWAPALDAYGVYYYQIHRCAGAGSTAFAHIGDTVETTWIDTTTTASSTYRYQVTAVDRAGHV